MEDGNNSVCGVRCASQGWSTGAALEGNTTNSYVIGDDLVMSKTLTLLTQGAYAQEADVADWAIIANAAKDIKDQRDAGRLTGKQFVLYPIRQSHRKDQLSLLRGSIQLQQTGSQWARSKSFCKAAWRYQGLSSSRT